MRKASESTSKIDLNVLEKRPDVVYATTAAEIEALDDGVPRQKGLFRTLWSVVEKLDRYGFEARGIERVPENRRTQTSVWDCFTMWFGANMTVSTFSLGTLSSSIFGLGLRESILTIVFFNLLSNAPVAYFATFGARTGFRQMAFSRFGFGYWTCMFPGVLNIVATVGWSTINTIVGGQTLHAVSDTHQLPIEAGIVIIGILTLIPCIAGYRYVHTYERYACIIPAVVFIMILGEGAQHMDNTSWAGSGPVEAAAVLSFGASVVGFGLGWVSYAADYTVNLPENTSALKIFVATYAGMSIPCIFAECLGAAYMTTLSNKTTWADKYEVSGVGGLIAAGLSPMGGFGQFLTVLMGLSVVAVNIPNIYSLSLTFQIFGPIFQAIPRLFVTILATIVYIVLAIFGAKHFEAWLDTLLVLISYWLSIFFALVTVEHLVFKEGQWSNYDFDIVAKPKSLPPGIASAFALGAGIAGAVLGMSQTWYVGVIARRIGGGGDIGFELAFAFTAVSYPAFRFIERRLFGR